MDVRSAVAWLVLLGACGDPDEVREQPLWSDGENLRDAEGRIAILRGINARVSGVFDVTLSDGRVPVEEVKIWLSRIHAARIAGTVVRNQWNHVTERLVLEVERARVPHAIYVPERQATTFRMTCNGAPMEVVRDPIAGLVQVSCDGTLETAGVAF